jgi:MscS family membrane protein
MSSLILVLAGVALLPAGPLAQVPSGTQIEAGISPLSPPDTTSPRNTLRTFLSESNSAIESLLSGEPDQLAMRRALATMDFSTTANGNTWDARIGGLLLLREIIDRISIPPEMDIPGDVEVIADDIAQWIIPETTLTIAKIQEGPRKGQFLFAADTVEQLQRYYRQVKSLPVKPGSLSNSYEMIYGGDIVSRSLRQTARTTLRPVDTSNPLATLEGFLESVNRAYALIMATKDRENLSRDELREIEKAVDNLLKRASLALDLSDIPEALRQDLGVQAVLQLKEIFDRLPLPPLDAIPDAEMVEAARKGEALSLWSGHAPLYWRYPNTEIEIVEVTEGERQGQFLFSAETVQAVDDYYGAVSSFPYRLVQSGNIELQYNSPELSPDFFHLYMKAPRDLIAGATTLGQWVSALPDWSNRLYAGQTVWKWAGLVLAVAIGAIGAYLIFWMFRRWLSPRGLLGTWLMVLPPLLIATLVYVLGRFVDETLNITGGVLAFVAVSATVAILVLVAWSVYLACDAAAETVIALRKIKDGTSDATMLRISARVVGVLFAGGVLIWGIRHLGADLIPILAGLGVGGLAVALAAQRTFANLLGSVMLFVNKPAQVGDFCRYGDQIGTVESIGLISTRIRSLERTIVTVPNAEFSEMQIDNFTARDQRLLKTVLQLRYETTPEQMRYVLVRLREMLLGHPMVTPEPARVRFSNFGAYSKDLEVFAYLRCQDHDSFCAIREDIFLRMDDIVAESGAGFAFPSQTAYLSRDQGLDAEKSEGATKRVQEWRTRRKLPFPDFDEEERERLEDTLDYPPKGSPDHQSRV